MHGVTVADQNMPLFECKRAQINVGFSWFIGQKLASNPEMPNSDKTASQPIFDRFARKAPKAAPVNEKASLDAQADEIRKAWVRSAPGNSK